jgi:hypothetical protein
VAGAASSVVSTSRSAAACSEVTTPTREERRAGALAGAGEQAFAGELFLEAQELLVEVADAVATRRFDVELEVAARLVKRDQHARFDVLAVGQSPAEQLRAAAEHDAAHLRGAVLEREVDVSGSAWLRLETSPATQHREKRRSSRSRARRLSMETGITGALVGNSAPAEKRSDMAGFYMAHRCRRQLVLPRIAIDALEGLLQRPAQAKVPVCENLRRKACFPSFRPLAGRSGRCCWRRSSPSR